MVGLFAEREEELECVGVTLLCDGDVGVDQHDEDALVHVGLVDGDGGEPLFARFDAAAPHMCHGEECEEEVGLGQVEDFGVSALPAEEEGDRLCGAPILDHDV